MLTKVLSTLETGLDGRVAMIHFQRDFLSGLSLKDIETEDIIAVARSIDGVQVLLFFKEIEEDYFRISIRSRGRIFRPPGRAEPSRAAATTTPPASSTAAAWPLPRKRSGAWSPRSCHDPRPDRHQQGKGHQFP